MCDKCSKLLHIYVTIHRTHCFKRCLKMFVLVGRIEAHFFVSIIYLFFRKGKLFLGHTTDGHLKDDFTVLMRLLVYFYHPNIVYFVCIVTGKYISWSMCTVCSWNQVKVWKGSWYSSTENPIVYAPLITIVGERWKRKSSNCFFIQ